MATRQSTSFGLFVLPILVFGCLQIIVTPLGDILALSWMYVVVWYGLSVLIGYLLLRRTRVTKDHEYRRSEIMKKMKHVYDAEAKGVWERETTLQDDVKLNTTNLNAKIGSFGREAPELELDQDVKSDVQMLTEQGFVQKATRRMSGDSAEDVDSVDSTVGSVRKKSWMDGIIDSIFNLFGRDKEAEREQQHQRRLRANADQTPVIAQRPIAPIKESITPEGSTNDALTMTSMSDEGGIISSTLQEPKPVSVPRKESIEDLAMLGGSRPSQSFTPTSGECPSCGSSNPPSERYCQSCGMSLSA
jgi:hypothetical protein